MPLAAPNLDDRSFQDLVDEAKKRIPHYIPEWTDHNLSDPGVMLIELFAWMTDIILYRLNQVPDLHYIKFMEMLGITRQEPVPAEAPVTFWLSAPQETAVTIPAGTEVASTQTESEPSIIFTTDEELRIVPPQLKQVMSSTTTAEGRDYDVHSLRRLRAEFGGFDIFSGTPQENDALYFGFSTDLSRHLLGFKLDFNEKEGAGIDTTLPPYVWEAYGGESGWLLCEVEMDTTDGLFTDGRIHLHMPQMSLMAIEKHNLYWVRVRVKEISSREKEQGMEAFSLSPELRQVSTASWGGTANATHAEQVNEEFLGRSDGSAGQRFYLQMTPVLERRQGEHLVVRVEGEKPKPWTEVPDFADSGAADPHYTLDGVTGEVRFGPAVQKPAGDIECYGAIPSRGANLVFEKYRYGGGQDGNIAAGTLNTLKTSIPFVARVSNRQPAEGGLDAETLESAMMRAPRLLRSRKRAVTAQDFEFLARQALPGAIGRVKCVEAGDGQVYVLVVPRIHEPARYLSPWELKMGDEERSALLADLEKHRLLTTRLNVRSPEYNRVVVKVSLRGASDAGRESIGNDVLARLYRFLNPLTGGPDGEGWPFGRNLFISDIYQCLAGVQSVRRLEMYRADDDGAPGENAEEWLEVLDHAVVASGKHEVEIEG